MRFITSLLLTLIVYSSILVFLYLILLPKTEKKQEVLIHTAIVNNITTPKIKKQNKKTTFKKPSSKPKIVKKVKKQGSKTALTKSGDVDFDDIFKAVKENVPTTPLKMKKTLEMSRFKGLSRVEKNLKKVQNLNVDVTINSSINNLKQKKIDEIINKIGQIWYEISDIAGEYAKIKVVSQNGSVKAFILESNLDKNKQNELISRIEKLNFDKNFDLNILFQTKVNK